MESGLLNGIGNGIGSGLGVMIGALAFGVVYNQLISWLEKNGRAEGYTALLVVGGVLFSLALAGLFIGLEAFLVSLLIFTLTGTPVALGSFWRHTEERKRAEEGTREIIEELRGSGWAMGDLMDELRALRREQAADDSS